ncbi:hypothetical protein DYB28_009490 [Aphanomyces astaci]|uniref:Uncharacterized protein n=1 Tax=Aphanomyces astaci TaxID=112090 RepID=A0A9X8DYM3_APHAT|nr:hypothetical protein DYB28_009490 [Aphanomyces astaci]
MALEGTVMEVIGGAAYIYRGVGDVNDAVYNDKWKTGSYNVDDSYGPSARFGHRMSVWKGSAVVYGGRFVQCLGDVWLRNASVVLRGSSTDTITDNPRSMVVLYCNETIVGIAPTIAVSSPWTHASARLVQQPMAREGTVLEVIGDAAYIYGGAGDSSDAVFNDAWKTAHGTDMYIFGGTSFDPKAIAANNDGTTQTNDVWKLDTMQSMWTVVDGGGHGGSFRPAARSQATAVSTPQAMVVFGGVVIPNVFYLSPVDLNDVWKFEYQSHTWHSVVIASNSSVPTTRFSHAATTIQRTSSSLNIVMQKVVL